MKIVQVAAPTTAGGLERVVESLAVGLHRRGHEVTVATLLFDQEGPHPFVEMLTEQGVRVLPIHLTPRAYLAERRAIADVCRSQRPDVVHTHGYRIDLLDRAVIARQGLPTVTTVHGASKMGGLKGAFFEWLQRRNYRRFDGVVAVSTPLRETTLRDGVDPDRLFTIPNAWGGLRTPVSRTEARAELGIDPDAPVVGWVGRLIRVKGGDVFLEALARLPEPRPLAVMIGYGPEADRLREQASALDLGGSLLILDEIRDAARYFAAFDTYVLSSRSEGLPIVILEAMAAGTPIVATRVGGITDALSEREGWLVDPEDPRALASAVTESLTDREEALRRAGRATRRLESDFALDAWLERHERMYAAVAGRAATGALRRVAT